MNLESLLFFSICCAGLTNILVDSVMSEEIFKRMFRKFHSLLKEKYNKDNKSLMSRIHGFFAQEWFLELLECHMCMGFWSGLFCGLFFANSIFHWILLGFAGSFISTFFYIIIDYISSHTSIGK